MRGLKTAMKLTGGLIGAAVLAAGGLAAFVWVAHLRIHGERTEFAFVSADGVELRGDLYLPRADTPVAAAVFLHGSGAEPVRTPDMAPIINSFLDQGIAFLAYDKRGVGRSGGDFATSLYADLVDDGVAAVAALRADARIAEDQIGIFAVSEGGWLAPEIAVRSGGLAFLSYKSAPTVSVIDSVTWETRNDLIAAGVTDDERLEAILAALVERWTYFIDAAQAGRRLPERKAAIEAEFERLDGPWRDAFPTGLDDSDMDEVKRIAQDLAHDPTRYLHQVEAPIFAAYGADDVAVPTGQVVAVLEDMRTARGKDVEYVVYPGEGHSLFSPARILSSYGYRGGYLKRQAAWARAKLDAREAGADD